MKSTTTFILTVCILMCTTVSNAQSWLIENYLAKKNYADSTALNFYTIKAAFNAYYEQHVKRDEDEIKFETEYDRKDEMEGAIPGEFPYKRWEWYNEQRVFPSGVFPTIEQVLKEYDNYKNDNSPTGRAGNTNQIASQTWKSLNPSSAPVGKSSGVGRINCMAFFPGSNTSFLIGTACGGVWKTTNSGTTWTVLNTDNLPSLSIASIAIDPTNANIIYIATGDCFAGIPNFFKTLQGHFSAGVFKSIDGGLNWIPTGVTYAQSQLLYPQQLIVDPVTPNVIMMATSTGIWRDTLSAMGNWTKVQAGNFYSLEFNQHNHKTVYATDAHGLWRSYNNGKTWGYTAGGYPNNSLAGRVSIGTTILDSNYIYLWGPTAGVKRSINGGTTFSSVLANPDNLVLPYGYYDRAFVVSPTNKFKLMVGGGAGTYRYVSASNTWTASSDYQNYLATNYVHQDTKRFMYEPAGVKLYALTDAGIFVTSNDGVTWTNISNGIHIAELYRVANDPVSADSIYYGAQDASTSLYTIHDNNVAEVLSSDGMQPLVIRSDSFVVFACQPYGTLKKSVNGSAFALASPGQSPWLAPYIVNPLAKNTMYIGSNLGVQKSYQQAKFLSWHTISASGVDSVTALVMAPSDTSVLYAAKFKKLARSVDAGRNWLIKSPTVGADSTFKIPAAITGIAVSATNAQKLWVTYSGYSGAYKVFKSADGGNSWTNYTANLPNVPVNCITYVNGSADEVIIGTDFGVFYRDSSMSFWVAYNAGLPNVIVNDLAIFYPTQKLRAATYGRGLWEVDLPFNVTGLPLQLINFNGHFNKQSAANELTWSVLDDEGLQYVEIFKSKDNINFEPLTQVNANNNGSQFQQYNYLDRTSISGISYYYLKMIDRNGAAKVSKVIEIKNTGTQEIVFYPNPIENNLQFQFLKNDAVYSLAFYDMLGKKVLEKQSMPVVSESSKFDVQQLPPGVYILALINQHTKAQLFWRVVKK